MHVGREVVVYLYYKKERNGTLGSIISMPVINIYILMYSICLSNAMIIMVWSRAGLMRYANEYNNESA